MCCLLHQFNAGCQVRAVAFRNWPRQYPACNGVLKWKQILQCCGCLGKWGSKLAGVTVPVHDRVRPYQRFCAKKKTGLWNHSLGLTMCITEFPWWASPSNLDNAINNEMVHRNRLCSYSLRLMKLVSTFGEEGVQTTKKYFEVFNLELETRCSKKTTKSNHVENCVSILNVKHGLIKSCCCWVTKRWFQKWWAYHEEAIFWHCKFSAEDKIPSR
jgi:hypothetical protein